MKSEVSNTDCLEAMRAMPDKAFDLAIVDPPYGIKRFEKGSLRFDKVNAYANGLEWDCKPSAEYFEQLFRVSERQIIWGGNNFTLPETEYFVIWNKMQTVPNFATCEYAWTNCKQPAQMFNYSIHLHNQITKIHPTEKPMQLYRWLLNTYAKVGNTILDTHLGSGSSRIAAYDLGFDFTGYELDKDYFEAQERRFADHIAQPTFWTEPAKPPTQLAFAAV